MRTERVTFAVCHGHKPGIVIDLANSKYDRVVLTVENPEEIAVRCPRRVSDASSDPAVRIGVSWEPRWEPHG